MQQVCRNTISWKYPWSDTTFFTKHPSSQTLTRHLTSYPATLIQRAYILPCLHHSTEVISPWLLFYALTQEWHTGTFITQKNTSYLLIIDRKLLKWIDCNQDISYVCLKEHKKITEYPSVQCCTINSVFTVSSV